MLSQLYLINVVKEQTRCISVSWRESNATTAERRRQLVKQRTRAAPVEAGGCSLTSSGRKKAAHTWRHPAWRCPSDIVSPGLSLTFRPLRQTFYLSTCLEREQSQLVILLLLFLRCVFVLFVWGALPAGMSLCAPHLCSMQGGQKRMMDLPSRITVTCEPPCWFWESNLCQILEEERPVLSTSKSLLYPSESIWKDLAVSSISSDARGICL